MKITANDLKTVKTSELLGKVVGEYPNIKYSWEHGNLGSFKKGVQCCPAAMLAGTAGLSYCDKKLDAPLPPGMKAWLNTVPEDGRDKTLLTALSLFSLMKKCESFEDVIRELRNIGC